LYILIASTIIGITSTRWLRVWIILEINVLAICGILSSRIKTTKKRESPTFMYYLVQVILSILIITWVFYSNKENTPINLLVSIAIIRKIGIWPIHGWYVKLITTIEIKQKAIIVIITWQKILPPILILTLQIAQTLTTTVLIIIRGTILASLSKLMYKIEIKKIIAITSINNNAWILLRALVSIQCFFTFIALYSAALTITLKIMEKIRKKSKHLIKTFWVNVLLIRNLSGLPPLRLFWGKIIVVKIIIKREIPTEIAIVLIISACLLMYHYLWITIGETSQSPQKSQISIKEDKEVKIILLITTSRIVGIGLFLTSGLTKRVYLDGIKLIKPVWEKV